MRKKISVKDIREKNKNNILSTIINNDGITRNQLATLSNVSLMTISNVVEDLLESDCIYEIKCKASIGRTPTMLHFNDNLGKFLSIDLTSNKNIEYIITNARKEIIISGSYDIDNSIDYLSNLTKIAENISNDIQVAKVNILGVGIITPGPHIAHSDSIATNLIKEQQNIAIKDFIQNYFGTDIIMVNHDVNMAAVAEAKAINSKTSLFYIHISDGVGGSYIHDNKLIQGVDLQAGDIGQILITLNDGRAESIENLLSLPAIERNSPLKLSINEIIDEYNNNNSKIVNYLDNIFDLFGKKIYNISWLLNPEYIVIYSSNKAIGVAFLKYYEEKASFKNLSSFKLISTKIKLSEFDTNPAILGTLDGVINKYIKIICKY